jgi:hypothetical protein
VEGLSTAIRGDEKLLSPIQNKPKSYHNFGFSGKLYKSEQNSGHNRRNAPEQSEFPFFELPVRIVDTNAARVVSKQARMHFAGGMR